MNLFDAIFTKASLSETVVLSEHQSITYADLREQALGFASILSSFDLQPGDRVAILLNDSPEFIAAFISICSGASIAVPINMALRREEQRTILNDCTATVAFVESGLCLNLLADAAETLPSLRSVIVVCHDNDEAESTRGMQRTRKEGPEIWLLEDLLTERKSLPISSGKDEEAPAFILYTSGSTGDPKGAVHSQSDVCDTNQAFCHEVLQLRSDDRLFSSSRLAFAYGLGNSLSFPLLNGATTILCREKPTPEIISRIFAEYRPTIFFGVPVVYNLLLDHHRRGSLLDCESLRLCISAGEALPARLGEEWEGIFGVPVLDGIGSTEMLHMFMSNHEGAVRYGSSGKLLQGYEAQLRDENGEVSPAGTEGNLWIKGASAARGYWQKPDVTAQTFVDGWVRTGDLYRCDEDGYWFHMGRSDDCFKSSGQWVSPVEVEGVLVRHPGVSQAAVVEDFDEKGLPCACAFIVAKEVESDSVRLEEYLRQVTRDALPRFKQPRRYVFVTELPYTATGKIQRFKLRAKLRGRGATNS